MCVRDSYVYQISGLGFFIREIYVRCVVGFLLGDSPKQILETAFTQA